MARFFASPALPSLALCALIFTHLIFAQNPGTAPLNNPALTTYKCTTAGGCTAQDTSLVLDWNFHWIHTADGSKSCTTTGGGVDSSLCPDAATCAQNCQIDAANYSSGGASTSGDQVTLRQYVNGQNASPRLYLLGSDGNYVQLGLLGQELRFDVDLSGLPCGENAALYLSSMDPSGGRNANNQGGASYGSGYCDAQCPRLPYVNGSLNTAGTGACCNEMDILEANSAANAFTPHACNPANTDCDKAGCGANPYTAGYTSYFGPGATIDTSKPLTVVTQFVASGGELTSIKRSYEQNGKPLPGAGAGADEITSCNAAYGGLAAMGRALDAGMTLVLSIWNDPGSSMNWLDSGSAGPCDPSAGNPANILAKYPDTQVVFSNIRWGDIGSTGGSSSGGGGSSVGSSATAPSPYPSKSVQSASSSAKSTSVAPPYSSTSHGAVSSPASKAQSSGNPTSDHACPAPTSKSAGRSNSGNPPPTTLQTKTTAPATYSGGGGGGGGGGGQQSQYGQCGGQGWSGPTQCAPPASCQTQNQYYAQCV